jgi:NADPH-dependent 2,4-dienoyl-CoA reductase/sulfur reductase-like enzyme/nitrite reductase/ring-hydroxylating ferredoxin subunit
MEITQVDGEDVLIIRRGDEVFAIGAHCTHYGGPLAEGLLDGNELHCPWHHACFDIRTGEPLRAPAMLPVACYDVELKDGKVIVGAKRVAQALLPVHVEAGVPVPHSVCIIGAGAAGNAAAQMLRRRGFDGAITMFGTEAPVDRPNLSKEYLAGHAPEDWLPLPMGERVDFRIARVTKLDANARSVTLDNGSTHAFDAILIATGADPVKLPFEGQHIHYLRTAADSKSIVAEAEKGKRAVVIGSSFIGLEVAASLREREVGVTVVAPEAIPLARILGDEAGKFVKRLHEEHGVVFRLGLTAKAIESDHVDLSDGTTLPCDFVVIGTGVRPNLQLAEEAGLTMDKGIVVDEFLQTSARGVYAAGDVARVHGRRVEHFVVAERMGQVAAENILGMRTPYRDAPFFWSAHYDVTFAYVGHAEAFDEVRIDGSLDAKDAKIELVNKGKVEAVVTLFRDLESLKAEQEMSTED